MKDFTANKAKKIANAVFTDELHNILVDIKAKAQEGETVMHVYKSLKGKTRDELTARGFNVVSQSSIAIQKEGMYYSIYWNK